MRCILSIGTILVATAVFCHLDAQSLADRVNIVRDNTVRLSFPTRPEICGDGKSIGERTDGGFTTHTFWSGGYSINSQEFWQLDCRTGPMRLVVESQNGRIKELRIAVGVDWLPDARGTDLGTFSGAEVANWLLDIAEANEEIAGVAFLAANAALDARIANRVFAIARDRDLGSEVRQRAVRWINRAAEREGMVEQGDRVMRELVLANGESIDVRERAIRSLRKSTENDAWLREQYSDIDRLQLRERVIRRLGESISEQNARWLRSIAINSNERVELRERALRVIGDHPERHDEVRALYGDLDRTDLKERVLRVVGDRGSPETMRWIRRVASDANEPTEVRDRAIRILGEGADLATMQQLYRDIANRSLRERVLRIAGEHRAADASEWLEQVATDQAEATELRDRALRLLAERPIATNDLAAIYDKLASNELRRRVIRILAERNDDAAVEKLRDIAETDPSRDLRRYALRRLGEIQ